MMLQMYTAVPSPNHSLSEMSENIKLVRRETKSKTKTKVEVEEREKEREREKDRKRATVRVVEIRCAS